MVPRSRREYLLLGAAGTTGLITGCFDSVEGTDNNTNPADPTDPDNRTNGNRTPEMTDPQTGDAHTQVTAPGITLSPGSSTTLQMSTSATKMVQIHSHHDGIEFQLGPREIEFEPEVDYYYTSQPTNFQWESPTSVDISVPLSISNDVDPGEYEYGVILGWTGEGSSDSIERTQEFDFTIYIKERSRTDQVRARAPGVALAPEDSTMIQVSTTPTELINANTGTEQLQFTYDPYEVEFDPPPDQRYSSEPPLWMWDSPTSVDILIPISASSDITPGTYEYSIELGWTEEGSNIEIGELQKFTFTVLIPDT